VARHIKALAESDEASGDSPASKPANESPVSVADAEEKRATAIETEVGGDVIQVNALVARIAAVWRQSFGFSASRWAAKNQER